jgi:UDP-GlcNAc3NAcA epimerase
MRRKILSVVGARPQFIKAAPVSRALAAAAIEEIMVHTGQHFDADMSDIFFEELEIPQPSINLGISGGTHGEMTGLMLPAIERVIADKRPDRVLVYGDTNSTLAAALAAAKLQVPVAHVEAGLRSFNRAMPEEINRVLTDHVSEILFCPTAAAVANLAREGISRGVHWVGDVMYDSALHATQRARAQSQILRTLGIAEGGYIVATVHRAESTATAQSLGAIFDYLRSAAAGRIVVCPLHPRTKKAAERFGASLDGIKVIAPVGYIDMTRLLDGCAEVMTDSGGLQKEAYFHRKPCTTLRSETEWVETVDAGWNRLWTSGESVTERRTISDYGDGHASEAIARILMS